MSWLQNREVCTVIGGVWNSWTAKENKLQDCSPIGNVHSGFKKLPLFFYLFQILFSLSIRVVICSGFYIIYCWAGGSQNPYSPFTCSSTITLQRRRGLSPQHPCSSTCDGNGIKYSALAKAGFEKCSFNSLFHLKQLKQAKYEFHCIIFQKQQVKQNLNSPV